MRRAVVGAFSLWLTQWAGIGAAQDAGDEGPSLENTRAACTDDLDNDGDGAIDCDDPDCGELVVCATSVPENTAGACQDGLDNDGDGQLDCADSECLDFVFCAQADGGDAAAAPVGAGAAAPVVVAPVTGTAAQPPGSPAQGPPPVRASSPTRPRAAATGWEPQPGRTTGSGGGGPDMGWVAAGLAVFAVGYSGAIVGGLVDEFAGRNCGSRGCGSWPWSFVPLVGGVLSGTLAHTGRRWSELWAWVVGLPAGIVQLTGLIFLIVGASMNADAPPATAVLGDGVALTFVPGAPGADAGLSLAVTF